MLLLGAHPVVFSYSILNKIGAAEADIRSLGAPSTSSASIGLRGRITLDICFLHSRYLFEESS